MKLTKTEKEVLKKELRKKERVHKNIEKMFKKKVESVRLNEPVKIGAYYNFIADASVEYFCVACMDNNFNLISNKIISRGTVNRCLTCKRELLIYCLLCDAVNVVVFHNHPSGNTTESKEDIESTKEFYQAFKTVGIDLVDSLIITKDCYNSLHEYFM